ncbi:unnamed protein product [Coffea canephora]|uniref:DH200=94 genomic scaffold, scaffold_1110 n=1 Tax=Coffea canephora TaxID=49390 RepID=A0A068VIA5_COFCA|nr:unnamed protein product [Coffea canephora]
MNNARNDGAQTSASCCFPLLLKKKSSGESEEAGLMLFGQTTPPIAVAFLSRMPRDRSYFHRA